MAVYMRNPAQMWEEYSDGGSLFSDDYTFILCLDGNSYFNGFCVFWLDVWKNCESVWLCFARSLKHPVGEKICVHSHSPWLPSFLHREQLSFARLYFSDWMCSYERSQCGFTSMFKNILGLTVMGINMSFILFIFLNSGWQLFDLYSWVFQKSLHEMQLLVVACNVFVNKPMHA